jgi:hypothetical protein
MSGYKTLAANAAFAVLGVFETFDWTSALGPKAGMVMTGLAIANMILRFFTTTPVGVAKS